MELACLKMILSISMQEMRNKKNSICRTVLISLLITETFQRYIGTEKPKLTKFQIKFFSEESKMLGGNSKLRSCQ